MVRRIIRATAVPLVLACLLVGSTVFSFPEMVRHGYGNCTTCHQSPNGGGILTPYGKKLSAEILSTWGAKNEEDFLYGLVQLPEWLNIGGDARALQLFQNRTTRQSTQFILMQMDSEVALNFGKFAAVGTGGVDYAGNPISRRHYAQFRATDELAFRFGRFNQSVGVNTENHAVAIKRGVGRDQATETYNLEASWIAQTFDVFATANFGRIDDVKLGAETGGALSASIFLSEHYKLGASYYYGKRDTGVRQLVGPFAILGLSKRFFILVDSGFQWFSPTGLASQTGFADTARIDYEIVQGVHAYFMQEFSKLDFTQSKSQMEGYGLGAQFFPRPHFELNLLWERQRYGSGTAFADYAFAMFHYYL